jgi:hypothetical protein
LILNFFVYLKCYLKFIFNRLKVKYLNLELKNMMNRPSILAMTAVILLMGTLFTLVGVQSALAQYGGDKPSSLEEQLNLAKAKVSSAQSEGAYGSGVSMVSAGANQTALFIGVLVAIFGAVAAAFFIMSRSRSHREPAK